MESESEKISIRDPLVNEEKGCCKGKKFVLLIILGLLILVGIIIAIIFIVKSLDDDKKETDKIFGLSLEELRKRTNPEFLGTKTLLKPDAPEYTSLAEGDKEALKHLVKAGSYLENIEYQIDDHYNLPFKKIIEEEIEKGNEKANLTKILFYAQKGINALDSLSQEIHLAAGHVVKPGIGVYPEDLTKEEFHKILIKMLKENKDEEVRNITNQRSIVVRDGEYLKAIDYVEYFKEDFTKIANEFKEAANYSTNETFNEYLLAQAEALTTADPLLDAKADILWADLQDTPLELTLTRENYDDELTGSFVENEELKQLLTERNITPVNKDNLGLRVGIVNKEGTEFLLQIKKYLPDLAKYMPYSENYTRNSSDEDEIKQTMVDADLVLLAGDVGAYRAGITLAENLPNDDKLSLKMGGGRRNVYHRQIRFVSNYTAVQEKLNAILDPEQHKYYDSEADHWFTIGHENTHSLGPNMANNNLGTYNNIIEENKADMGALSFVDLLKNLTYYTEEQRLKIIVTVVTDTFLKVKPDMSQTHRVRTVMQNYFLFKEGAYSIVDGKIHVNIDKVVPAAYKMLTKIIEIQLHNNFGEAEDYIKENFKWTDEMTIIGDKLQKLSSVLNCKVENELADVLLAEN